MLVGWSSLMADHSSGQKVGHMLMGDLLVVAGQFANALQFIVEEVCQKEKREKREKREKQEKREKLEKREKREKREANRRAKQRDRAE